MHVFQDSQNRQQVEVTACCALVSASAAGKDIFWYAKNKDDMGVTQDELAAVKAREREMMAEVGPVHGLVCKSTCSIKSRHRAALQLLQRPSFRLWYQWLCNGHRVCSLRQPVVL
jgi:hypothetical protein